MDKNVFTKNKKYNPDVVSNHEKKRNERDTFKYQHTEKFFNLNNQSNESLSKQLSSKEEYKIDRPKEDLDAEIQKKMNERKNQEFDFKGSKNIIPSSNPNEFHQFNDLKNSNERQQDNKNEDKKKSEHESMMDNLKSLGILN